MTVAVGALGIGLLPGAGSAGAAQPSGRRAGSGSSWTQFRYDSAATGFNSAETGINAVSTSNAANLTLAWKFDTKGSIYGGNPAVFNSTVYVGSQGGGFYALDEAAGTLKWSLMTTGLIDGAPVVDPALGTKGTVYFSSFDSNVYACDISASEMAGTCAGTVVGGKPKPLWTFTSAGPVEGGMNLAGSVLYAASLSPTQTGPGTVYALSTALNPTNRVIWQTLAGGPVESSPAVANGVVYVGSEDKSLHAFNAATGAPMWTYPVGSAVDSSPAVANGVVYFGADNGNEYAVSTTTHLAVWKKPFKTGRFLESSAGISGNTLVIGSADNNIYILDATLGTLLKPPIVTGLQIESSPAVANGVACIGSRDTHMRCLDISQGTVLFKSNDMKKSSNASPSIADGMVFMGSNDHFLYAYHH